MKPPDLERKGPQQALQHWDQIPLADPFNRPHELILRDLIHHIDVIDTLDFIQVALVHRVDPQVACAALGTRAPALPDRDLHRACRNLLSPAPPIRLRVPQVVQVPVRKAR